MNISIINRKVPQIRMKKMNVLSSVKNTKMKNSIYFGTKNNPTDQGEST